MLGAGSSVSSLDVLYQLSETPLGGIDSYINDALAAHEALRGRFLNSLLRLEACSQATHWDRRDRGVTKHLDSLVLVPSGEHAACLSHLLRRSDGVGGCDGWDDVSGDALRIIEVLWRNAENPTAQIGSGSHEAHYDIVIFFKCKRAHLIWPLTRQLYVAQQELRHTLFITPDRAVSELRTLSIPDCCFAFVQIYHTGLP